MNNERKIFSDTYEIIGYLQAGSGGVVYKAYHKRLKKEVILKKIKQKNVNIRIKRQEVDILKNLNHSYLPQVLDFLNVDDEIYTVMSYIPGYSFKELLDKGTKFEKNDLIKWGMQICSALDYLHHQNPAIIHGDIKPANIMLTPQGDICLIDFNISFFMDENTVLGYTEGYTSPEQYIIALDKESIHSLPKYTIVDEKSDIYSVGATFYHLITGTKLSDRRRVNEYERMEECVGEAFASVIMKAITLERDKRYANAREMYYAFENIYKKDRNYKNLIAKQTVIRVCLLLLLGSSIVTLGYGIHELKVEKIEKYNDLVSEQISYQKNREFDEAEQIHEEAVELIPEKLESYYQNAQALYAKEEYQECIDFIEYDVFQNEKVDILDERIGDVYSLEAKCFFELEDYKSAVETYEKAFRYNQDNEVNYRDYAIALAYNSNENKARDILEEAIKKGLEKDSIYYAKGEIEKSLGKWNDAVAELKKCISISEDDELKMRSYILISDIYQKNGNLDKARKILLKARKKLPTEYLMLILENLIKIDIDLADQGNTELRKEAIELSKEVIEQGWDTYTTYNNLVILNQKLCDFSETEKFLQLMKEKYGDDYNIEKRYAFLEIEKQEFIKNEERNYEMFEEYFIKAEKMYYEQLKNNNTDSEMKLLENVYQQVKSGGW